MCSVFHRVGGWRLGGLGFLGFLGFLGEMQYCYYEHVHGFIVSELVRL